MTTEPKADEATTRWELWNLQALYPRADLSDLALLREKRLLIDHHENRALERLVRGGMGLLEPGRDFLANHPELASGVLLTMHIGPYQFLPEPFLAAGIDPGILLLPAAHRHHRERAEQVRDRLGLSGRIDWIPIDSPTFASRMLGVLRAERPLIVFLDGNSGLGGAEKTRDQGIPYSLPGRDIQVRTGLGRLVCRLGCPVHPVVVRWRDDGEIVWHKENSQRWSTEDDSEHVTRLLYDWGFGEVMSTPEQWSFWPMLRDSYTCFASHRLTAGTMPPAVREDFRRAFQICLLHSPESVHVALDKEVEVWPGDVLANLTEHSFYAAEGLQASELSLLRDGIPSLAQLQRQFGEAWVRFHVLRLCLLDLAHLRGA